MKFSSRMHLYAVLPGTHFIINNLSAITPNYITAVGPVGTVGLLGGFFGAAAHGLTGLITERKLVRLAVGALVTAGTYWYTYPIAKASLHCVPIQIENPIRPQAQDRNVPSKNLDLIR